MSKPTIAGVVGLVVLASLSSNAIADELEERNVSALGAKDKAVSISVIDKDELSSRGVIGLSDLAAGSTAGLYIQGSEYNASSLDVSIRGIGGTASNQLTGESGVGTFVDGVYIARGLGLGIDLVDLENIEVRRGSQGVLSGRNTLGGAVYLTSAKPSGVYGLEQTLRFGLEYGEVRSLTHLDLPEIADVLSIRLSVMVNQHDGWVENEEGVVAFDNYFPSKDNEGHRVALRLKTSETSTIDYAFEDSESTTTHPYFQVSDIGQGGSGLSVENGRSDTTRSAIPIPEAVVDISSHNITASWFNSEQFEFKLITGLRDVNSREFTNFDGLLGAAVVATSAGGDHQQQEQITQEFQFKAKLYDGALNLVGGVAYLNEQVELDAVNTRGESETNAVSVYGQGTWAVSDAFDIIVGVRGSSEDKELLSIERNGVATNQTTDIDDDNTDYSLAFSFDLTDTTNLYLSFATGYKSAGASFFADDLTPYEAETSETIELGFNGSLFESRVDYQFVVFNTEIEDRQLAFTDPDNRRFTDIINGGDATIRGLEFSFNYALSDKVALTGEYYLVDTDVTAINIPYKPLAGEFEFEVGAGASLKPHIAHAPVHSGSLGVDYGFGDFEYGTMVLHVEYVSMASHVLDSFTEQRASRDVFNARLNLADFELEGDQGRIDIILWANNLTDKEYADNRFAIYDGTAANTYTVSSYGEPRAFGVDVSFEF